MTIDRSVEYLEPDSLWWTGRHYLAIHRLASHFAVV